MLKNILLAIAILLPSAVYVYWVSDTPKAEAKIETPASAAEK